MSSDATKPPVLCLMGPTATGKTDAAAACFDAFKSEIVSVDSSLVYRGMDIGTAKPSNAFLERYPHQLVDIRNPDDTYSVAEFVADANNAIDRAHCRGHLPILVGGTQFYFHALEQGLAKLPVANAELRAELSARGEREGWPALHTELAQRDPQRAEKIDPMDAQRIQRALEINTLSGQRVPQLSSAMPALPYRLIKVALVFSDRRRLHERIALRYHNMIEQGLVREVQGLLEQGLDAELPAMRMIGYRQTIEYCKGDVSLEHSIEKGIAATRQLAKRQLTWLRNQAHVTWWVDQGLMDQAFDPLIDYIAASVNEYAKRKI